MPASPQAAERPATVGEKPPRLADGIELIGEFTGSGFKEAPYLARRADGQIVQIGELFYFVAEEIDGRRGYDEIAERATERAQRELSEELARYVVDEKLRPLGLIATDDGASAKLQKIDPLLALKLRVGVVPERVVNAVAAFLRPLFLQPVVVAVVVGLIAFDVWLFGFHGIAQSLRQTLYEPAFILLTLGLVVVSAAFHECGHATACRYGGARPGKMGVGLYLVWPAFYTDVTDAYRLDRAGRLRTDLGGVYFNAIFILFTGAAYFATGFEPLLLIIPIQHAEILHQFLPVVRLDGYYIVSDLTGVPDMFQRIGPTLKSLLPWRKPEQSVRELKRSARVVVTAYVLTLVPLLLFVLAITVINMPRILATSWDAGVVEYDKIHEAIDAGAVLSAAASCIQLAVLVLVPAGLLLTLVQLGRKVAAGAWKATEDRSAARAGVVLAAAAAASFAAYTWYPTAVYRPIEPSEKGTLLGAFEQLAEITSGRPALTEERARELDAIESRAEDVRSGPPGTTPRPPRVGRTDIPPRPKPVTPSSPRPGIPGVTAPQVTVSTPTPSPTVSTPVATVTAPTSPLPTVTTPTISTPTVSPPTITVPTTP
jgi:putative peptide zinc metalloprotease protein